MLDLDQLSCTSAGRYRLHKSLIRVIHKLSNISLDFFGMVELHDVVLDGAPAR